jgi:hypothetical protein
LESPDFPNVFCAAVDHAVADVLTVLFDVAGALDILAAFATTVDPAVADVTAALCFLES